MKTKRPVRRGKRESGNAMVEGALYFLPLMALIFGILDFSMALFITGALQESARDACRFATTYNLTYNGTTYTTQTKAAKAAARAFVDFLVAELAVDGRAAAAAGRDPGN